MESVNALENPQILRITAFVHFAVIFVISLHLSGGFNSANTDSSAHSSPSTAQFLKKPRLAKKHLYLYIYI